jgi:hypothetical protein
MVLLGPAEKKELEAILLAQLTAYWNSHGAQGILAPGVFVALDAKGPSIVAQPPKGALGCVEVRTLFTALCHLNDEGPAAFTRENLTPLAEEAATALAAQVNRLSPD